MAPWFASTATPVWSRPSSTRVTSTEPSIWRHCSSPRKNDSGRTWQTIVHGIPPQDAVEVVREDPTRAKLLYAATTTGVFVSHDDGDRWESLQLNLPHTMVTDLDVHGDDLVASTYGR